MNTVIRPPLSAFIPRDPRHVEGELDAEATRQKALAAMEAHNIVWGLGRIVAVSYAHSTLAALKAAGLKIVERE